MILAHPRPLTAAEAFTLRQALQVSATRHFAPEILESINSLQVAEECDCGCATVWFIPSTASPGHVVAEANTQDGDLQIGVTVFAKNSKLSGLEVTGGMERVPLPSPNAKWTAI